MMMYDLSAQYSDSSVFDPISLLPEDDISEGRTPTVVGKPPEVAVLEPSKTELSGEKLKYAEPAIAPPTDAPRVSAKSVKRKKLTKSELKKEVDMVSKCL